ncbi:efflux RND transporter periplasmic adaptor subunit [Aureimonas sp. AU40]|uniref:efflux RND transporter periplasmic adaptor subunit n=1 Tax=Aureimonas sp. AU40 TaxID=1637747 RepID=UPI00078558EF|nr:efflux RND transporter periplasmic adaptor subunit [Aureimonas sp. AU40]
MAFLRQIVVTVLVLLVALGVWMMLSPLPGRLVLESGLPLPQQAKDLIARLSPEDAEKVGATPAGRDGNQAAPLVVVDPALPAVTRDRLRALGTGEAVRSVAIRADATGIVAGIGFASGEVVKAGATLAVLQNDAERVAVDRAKLALTAAEDQLKRYQSLSAGAAITAVQLDEVARARDAAALDLQTAEIALRKRDVTSPIAGRVGLLDLDIGDLVDSSTQIAVVDDRSQLKILFNVPEAYAAELAIGQTVTAEPTTRTGRVFQGRLTALDSRIDEASRTLRAEAVVDNAEDLLRPGMSFGISMEFPGQTYVSVDPLAIQWERAGSYVWTVEDGKAVKKPVGIIERNVDRILVASDTLKANEPVVREGLQQLREGLSVRVREPVQAPVPADATDAPAPVPSAAADPANGRRAELAR